MMDKAFSLRFFKKPFFVFFVSVSFAASGGPKKSLLESESKKRSYAQSQQNQTSVDVQDVPYKKFFSESQEKAERMQEEQSDTDKQKQELSEVQQSFGDLTESVGQPTLKMPQKMPQMDKQNRLYSLSSHLLLQIVSFLDRNSLKNFCMTSTEIEQILFESNFNSIKKIKSNFQIEHYYDLRNDLNDHYYILLFLSGKDTESKDSQELKKLIKSMGNIYLTVSSTISRFFSFAQAPWQKVLADFQIPVLVKEVDLLRDQLLLPQIVHCEINLRFQDHELQIYTGRKNDQDSFWTRLQNFDWILPVVKENEIQISLSVDDVLHQKDPFINDLLKTRKVKTVQMTKALFMYDQLASLQVLTLGLERFSDFVEIIPLLCEKTPGLRSLKIYQLNDLEFDAQEEINPKQLTPLNLMHLKELTCSSFINMSDVLFGALCDILPPNLKSLDFDTTPINIEKLALISKRFDSLFDLMLCPKTAGSEVSLSDWIQVLSKHKGLLRLKLHFLCDYVRYDIINYVNLLHDSSIRKYDEVKPLFPYIEMLFLCVEDSVITNLKPFSDMIVKTFPFFDMHVSKNDEHKSKVEKNLVIAVDGAQNDLSLFVSDLLRNSGSNVFWSLPAVIMDRLQKNRLLRAEDMQRIWRVSLDEMEESEGEDEQDYDSNLDNESMEQEEDVE